MFAKLTCDTYSNGNTRSAGTPVHGVLQDCLHHENNDCNVAFGRYLCKVNKKIVFTPRNDELKNYEGNTKKSQWSKWRQRDTVKHKTIQIHRQYANQIWKYVWTYPEYFVRLTNLGAHLLCGAKIHLLMLLVLPLEQPTARGSVGCT